MRDFCGQYRADFFVLVTALKEGVAEELLKSSQISFPQEIALARLSKRLQDLEISNKSARWAVNSWALALEIDCQLEESGEETESQQQELIKTQGQANYWKQSEANRQEKLQELEEELETQKEQQKKIEEKAQKIRFGLIAITLSYALIATAIGVFFYRQEQEIEQRKWQIINLNRDDNDKLEGKLERIEAAIEKEFDGESGKVRTGRRFYLKNRCSEPIEIATRYKQISGDWKTDGWWNFDPNQYSYLVDDGED